MQIELLLSKYVSIVHWLDHWLVHLLAWRERAHVQRRLRFSFLLFFFPFFLLIFASLNCALVYGICDWRKYQNNLWKLRKWRGIDKEKEKKECKMRATALIFASSFWWNSAQSFCEFHKWFKSRRPLFKTNEESSYQSLSRSMAHSLAFWWYY